MKRKVRRPRGEASASAAVPGHQIEPQQSGFELQRRYVAERIRASIAQKNVAELARALGVSRSTIYDWANGVSLPGVERMAQLAASTEASLVWLITGQGPRRADLLPAPGYVVPEIDAARAPSPVAFNRAWLGRLLADFYGPGQRDDERWAEGSQPYLFCINDDAMTPTLAAGDLVLVNAVGVVVPGGGERLPRNGIYLFKGDQLRRVEWQIGGGAVISADNTFYGLEARKLEGSELPFVVGPAIWHGRRV